MKANPDPQPDDALLDAMLRDDEWQTANAAFKNEALRAFYAGHRVRRIRRWTGAVALLAVATAAALQFSHLSFVGPRSSRVAVLPSNPPPRVSAPAARVLSDQELVAAFPKGSCFMAEIDGRKQLVFVNPQLERRYVSHAGAEQN